MATGDGIKIQIVGVEALRRLIADDANLEVLIREKTMESLAKGLASKYSARVEAALLGPTAKQDAATKVLVASAVNAAVNDIVQRLVKDKAFIDLIQSKLSDAVVAAVRDEVLGRVRKALVDTSKLEL